MPELRLPWRGFLTAFTIQRPGAFLLTFSAYLVTAKLSQYLFFSFESSPAIISPAAGLAFAAIFLGGYRLWLPVFLAQLVSGATSPALLSPLLILTGSLGATLQALLAVFVLKKFGFTGTFTRMSDAWLLILGAFFFTTINPLFFNTVRLLAESLSEPFWTVVSRGWAGGVLSYLIFIPLLTIWIPFKKVVLTWAQYMEVGLSFISLIGVNIILFWMSPHLPQAVNLSMVYILFAVLAWISLRLGTHSMSMALLLTLVVGVIGALFSPHPERTIAQQLFSVEIFLEFTAVVFIAFMAISEERRLFRKSLEDTVAKLHQSMAEMQHVDKAKNEFIAILAHELRNPLAPVMSTLELLRYRERDAESIKLIESAEQQTHLMRRLLDDLLDVARVAQQKFELQKEDADIATLIRHSVISVESFVKSKRQTLTVDMPHQKISASVDPVRFEQIITNLLNNAIKYTPTDGKIRISARAENREAVISVSDTGVGIAPQDISAVFLPFRQMQSKIPRRGTGLGIGLSLTKRLVEMHGGSVGAESPGLDKGSTFTVRLPLLTEATPLKKPKEIPTTQSSFRILIVDDNQPAADGLARLLELKGHTVSRAYTGEEAIRIAADFDPDVVLLDIGLPDMDGYDVAKSLRSGTREPVFIAALTGYGQEEDRAQAREAGFNYHITKPARIVEIEAMLAGIPT